ncbi:Short chain dehydrogenase protein [Pleurostoma richardsiae]|uniref:Short chain dehydrogenase protein n=1 Tax=Pleurostoma richardsiae TaxID=41990 RepID=A0AA38VL09_9PEZI|nr:Short chain dehydrogenase protein [Pleurostoma richardsiae]
MPSSKFDPDTLPDLTGKIFLVTGGNAGIGKATVAGLAGRGATVYMGARSPDKALSSIADIRREFPAADIRFVHIDHANLESVVVAAGQMLQTESKLHGLVNNAGVMGIPYLVTQDHFEIQFQTNYVSHWLLTQRLLPLLMATARVEGPGAVRIVNVTSDGHSRYPPKEGIRFNDINLEKESSMARYGQSKLANILHVQQLNKRYGPGDADGPGVPGEIWTAAVHPGHIDTGLNKQATAMAPPTILRILTPLMRCAGILDEQAKGALSSLFAVASPEFTRSNSGAYVVPYAKIGTPSAAAEDAALAGKLWDWTTEALQSKGLLL